MDDTSKSQASNNQEGETIQSNHTLLAGATLLPSDPIPTATAGETSPRDLLLDDHEQRIVQLRARVEALEAEVSKRAASVYHHADNWIDERMAELYGHLGLHQSPRE